MDARMTALDPALLDDHLRAARGGDPRAFGHVVGHCQNTVTSLALAIVRDVPASEDIAQEAFIRAWQQLGELRSEASFLPWLRQITRNLARDHLRATRRRPVPVDPTEAVIAAVADPGPCPAERGLIEEQQQAATEIIDQLPDETREVLLLYYREGQSSQQVAHLLGLSDAAVRKRLSRARASIREQLLERLGDFARRSAPGTAFTGAVLLALGLASPPAAAATLLTVGGALGGKSVLKVLGASAGAMAIGLLAAFAGIFYGLKRQLRVATSQAERRTLIRSALINAAATVGFMTGMVVVAAWTRGWLAPALLGLVFMGTVFWQSMVVQPRATRARRDAEARIDPEGAARRRRRERIQAWAGLGIGLVFGGGGLVFGLVASGRIHHLF